MARRRPNSQQPPDVRGPGSLSFSSTGASLFPGLSNTTFSSTDGPPLGWSSMQDALPMLASEAAHHQGKGSDLSQALGRVGQGTVEGILSGGALATLGTSPGPDLLPWTEQEPQLADASGPVPSS